MSNSSQDKVPALKREQAKEDPRGTQTAEQQAEERCRDAVHQARTEPTQTTEPSKNAENSERKDQAVPKFKLGVSHTEYRDIDDHRVQIPTDAYDLNKLYEHNMLRFTGKEIQEQKQTSYPKAEVLRNANGEPHHIDLSANKELKLNKDH